MGVLTEYGKELRHIRLDYSEILGTMADKLGVSPSYLSSIETGSRAIPPDLTDKVINSYGLAEEAANKLMKAEINTSQSLTINLDGASDEQIEATVLFAREIKNMTVNQIKEIYKNMNRGQ